MPAPRLTAEERAEFLASTQIAKIATHDPDGSIRIAPLWVRARDDGTIEMNTWTWTKVAQNLTRDPKATVLIDSSEMPYRGVHLVGTAKLGDESTDPEVFGRWFGAYTGSEESGLEYAGKLIEQGGPRIPIFFTPDRSYTWDFGKG
jgi:hypothetical protein